MSAAKLNGEIDWSKNSKPKTRQKINGEIDFSAELKKTNHKMPSTPPKKKPNNFGNRELLELTKELQKVNSEIKEYRRNMEEEYGGIKYVLYLKNDPHFLGLLAKREDIRKQIRKVKRNG